MPAEVASAANFGLFALAVRLTPAALCAAFAKLLADGGATCPFLPDELPRLP